MADRSDRPYSLGLHEPEQPFLWPEDLEAGPDWLLHDMGLHRLWKALVAENFHPVLAAFNSGGRDDPDKAEHRERLYALLTAYLAHRATLAPPCRETCALLTQVLELDVPAVAVRDRYLSLLRREWINVREGPEEMLADAEARHRTAWAEAAVALLTVTRRRALLTDTSLRPNPELVADAQWVAALQSLQEQDATRISRELITATVRQTEI